MSEVKSKVSMKSQHKIRSCEMAYRHTKSKNEQLEAAVWWCKERNVRGQATTKTGLFPLIKDGEIINHRLDGKIINGQERKYCRILTEEEEQKIVTYVKNKNIWKVWTKVNLQNLF